jgi:hypothetical protein
MGIAIRFVIPAFAAAPGEQGDMWGGDGLFFP